MKNNKPVAWMYEAKNVDGKPYISDVSLKPLFGLVTRYGYKEIPLYTHPVKELTTTNITKIHRPSDQSITIEFTSCRASSEFVAILRKNQEK